MKHLIAAFTLMSLIPAASADSISEAVEKFQDLESSWPIAQFLVLDARNLAVDPIENRILQLASKHDEASVHTKLDLANILNKLGSAQIDSREEMNRFAGTHTDMIHTLCDLANEPMAKGNPDISYVLKLSVTRGRLDALLSEIERPELTTSGLLNLLAVFDGWYIRDRFMKEKIKASLQNVVQRYNDDGYIWKFRWGARVYSDAEQNAVIDAASKIRSKSLLK